jgi:hypothetical protein
MALVFIIPGTVPYVSIKSNLEKSLNIASTTSVTFYQWTRHNTPEDLYFQQHRCQNLKFRNTHTPPPHGSTAPSGAGPPHYRRFTLTLRHITVGRTSLDEWSARLRYLYPTTHNTHNRQTCRRRDSNPQSPQASGRRPATLDRAAIGICQILQYTPKLRMQSYLFFCGTHLAVELWIGVPCQSTSHSSVKERLQQKSCVRPLCLPDHLKRMAPLYCCLSFQVESEHTHSLGKEEKKQLQLLWGTLFHYSTPI